mmetsp:Transcript_24549/g.56609  ORF Transcript_24549/g.56609 Transcript_24549/m.56609 type:complete len:214 (-) Transcript_24549:566-1207(-)
MRHVTASEDDEPITNRCNLFDHLIIFLFGNIKTLLFHLLNLVRISATLVHAQCTTVGFCPGFVGVVYTGHLSSIVDIFIATIDVLLVIALFAIVRQLEGGICLQAQVAFLVEFKGYRDQLLEQSPQAHLLLTIQVAVVHPHDLIRPHTKHLLLLHFHELAIKFHELKLIMHIFEGSLIEKVIHITIPLLHEVTDAIGIQAVQVTTRIALRGRK